MNPNEISDPDFRLLGEEIVKAMEYYRVPGVAVGVLRDGEEFTAGFGVTNVDHPLPVDADTLFQIGSTTKTFTATLAMRLIEIGKLGAMTAPNQGAMTMPNQGAMTAPHTHQANFSSPHASRS